MLTCRNDLGSAVLDGHLYAAGGEDWSHCELKSVEKYNPLTNEWTAVAKMNEERSGVRLAVANGKLYAVGGDKTSEKDSIEIFDPEKDHWTFLGYLNDRRLGAGVGVIRILA
ncbi:kelch repeat protein [Cooperia oncophora]